MAVAAKPEVTDPIMTMAEAHEAAAMPRSGAVHADPDATPTAESVPLPEELACEDLDAKSPAQWAYERLVLYINNFEEQLDDKHEVAMGLAGGDVGVLQIEGLGYYAPDIVTFYGRDEDGARTQLIQHVSQLNVMLVAAPKAEAEEEPRRIGFRLATGLGKDARKRR